MTDEEIIAVVTAHKEGKTIESRIQGSQDWVETEPSWNFLSYDYRIKPEPHYRPFKSAEEVMEAIKEHGDWVKQSGYEHYDRICRVESGNLGTFDIGYISLENAFEELTFIDGTPFGVKED